MPDVPLPLRGINPNYVPPPIKVLFVGDPHVTVEELPDCARLLAFVDKVAVEEKPTAICFLGDQHHTHAVVRVEVLEFWARWLSARRSEADVWMLVGNHDRSHDTSVVGDTLRYSERVTIIDKPLTHGPLALIPWQPTHDDFRKAVEQTKLWALEGPKPAPVIICHQTFAGCKYENGFYAPDGFPAEELEAKLVISGHIHTPQAFGKVWYPGAPRWRIATDANTERAIVLVTFDATTGVALDRKLFETAKICSPLVTLEDVEGDASPLQRITPFVPGLGSPLARVTVNVRGSPEFVQKQCAVWKAKGWRPLPFPTRVARHEVREADGIAVALRKHIELYQPRFGSDPVALQKLVAERVKL